MIQNFYEVQVVKERFRWRGVTWYQAEIDLYKTSGGYQKTEEEYRALLAGWGRPRFQSHQKVFVDECLFTFDEIVALRKYFRTQAPEPYGRDIFRALLFMNFPIDAKTVGPSSPSLNICDRGSLRQIHYYRLPNFPLEIKLMGFGKFRGMAKEQEEEQIKAELERYDWKYTRKELEKKRAEGFAAAAERREHHDAEEVALHGPSAEFVKDGTNFTRKMAGKIEFMEAAKKEVGGCNRPSC